MKAQICDDLQAIIAAMDEDFSFNLLEQGAMDENVQYPAIGFLSDSGTDYIIDEAMVEDVVLFVAEIEQDKLDSETTLQHNVRILKRKALFKKHLRYIIRQLFETYDYSLAESGGTVEFEYGISEENLYGLTIVSAYLSLQKNWDFYKDCC